MAADQKTANSKISLDGSRRLIEQVDAAQALRDASDAVVTAMSGVALLPGREAGVQLHEVQVLEEWSRARGLAESALKVVNAQIARLQPRPAVAT